MSACKKVILGKQKKKKKRKICYWENMCNMHFACGNSLLVHKQYF